MYLHNHLLKKINTEEDIHCISEDILEQRISGKSLYKDDVWIFENDPSDVRFNFKHIHNDNLRETTKQVLFYEILFPTQKVAYKPATLEYTFRSIKRLISYMESESIDLFGDVTRYDYQKYIDFQIDYLKSRGNNTSGRLKFLLNGLQILFTNRDRIEDGLTFDPTMGHGGFNRFTSNLLPKTPSQGGTKRIPNYVVKQIVDVCLKYLSRADEILDIYSKVIPYMSKNVRLLDGRCRDKSSSKIGESLWHYYHKAIKDGLISPPPPIAKTNNKNLSFEIARLNTVCCIMIQLLTGMRVSELFSLRKKTLRKEMEVDGSSLYSIEGKLIKQQRYPKKTRWNGPELLSNCCKILERISDILSINQDQLILFLGTQYTFQAAIGRVFSDNLEKSTYSRTLRRFFKEHSICDEDGATWGIKSHQFRKTYACLMAESGTGLGILQHQMKHRSLDMTAEYGDYGLLRNVQEEKTLLQTAGIENLLLNPDKVCGEGRSKVKTWAAEFNGLATDKKREQFIRGLAATLTIQTNGIGLCITDPSRDTKCNGAAFGSCDPACQHLVVPMQTHGRIYKDAISQIKHLLNNRAQNELQKVQLQADLKHYEDVAKEWSSQ